MSSIWAQIFCVLCCWDVSVSVGLEGGNEILLVVRVVHAVLKLVLLSAVNCAVGGEWEYCGFWDLVEVLWSVASVLKAVEVLGLYVV